MEDNCVGVHHREDNTSYGWGKHYPPSVVLNSPAMKEPPLLDFFSSTLQVVLIKDPATWITSMWKSPYSVKRAGRDEWEWQNHGKSWKMEWMERSMGLEHELGDKTKVFTHEPLLLSAPKTPWQIAFYPSDKEVREHTNRTDRL